MNLELARLVVEGFHDGGIGAAQTVAEQVDLGDPDLSRQVRHDLLHGRVQVMTVLHQVAGHPRARCGDDEAGKRRGRHGQHVVAGAVERPAQGGNLGRIAVAAGARYDDGQRRRAVLRGKPHPQFAVEPKHIGHGPCPGKGDVDFGERNAVRHRRQILRRRTEYRGAQRRRIGKSGGGPGRRGRRDGLLGFRPLCESCGQRRCGDRQSQKTWLHPTLRP